ncbi:MAG: mechanosensitive ion channel [Mycobacterium sp.]|jgi:small-conductance mechanosensitive channel/CRP-like cAMP-binding protein|nr:mechanosensitive ion channel [Mycobacterium sp.]
MSDLLSAPWFYWAVGLAIGLPLALVVLTEWQQVLRRRGSLLLRPVTLLRNVLLPAGALLLLMTGATQMPVDSPPVRIVGTLVAFAVLVLLLSGVKASVFSSAPQESWRQRVPGIFLDVIRFVIIAVGLGLIMAYIWGAKIGGLFTALGIGSIVVGLTLQNSVGQIISGLLMLFEQPFRIGDWIQTSEGKGRVVEVNWRAVHVQTSTGVQITPNSVLAGQSFLNLSRPVGNHLITVSVVFAVEDRPDQVCAMLTRVASRLPQCAPDRSPSADHIGALHYSVDIPLRSANEDWSAKTTFLRWIWYAARREGLHLDEADDTFTDPELVRDAIRTFVTPILRLDSEQQRAMERYATVERYGSGELIQSAGAVPDALSFIISGQVQGVAEDQDGSRADMGVVERGSLLGVSALIRNPAMVTSMALDEVTLLNVEREAIEDVVQRNPELLRKFDRSIDERRADVMRALSDDDAAVASPPG